MDRIKEIQYKLNPGAALPGELEVLRKINEIINVVNDLVNNLNKRVPSGKTGPF